MSRLYFKISEYIRRPDLEAPVEVSDKILAFHLWPMNPVRSELGSPIKVSRNSGFRHPEHEKDRGRDVNKEHTFGLAGTREGSEGYGASDYTTDFKKFESMVRLIIERTDYSRIAFYPEHMFVHCDYRFMDRGKKVFIASPEWKEASEVELYRTIHEASVKNR